MDPKLKKNMISKLTGRRRACKTVVKEGNIIKYLHSFCKNQIRMKYVTFKVINKKNQFFKDCFTTPYTVNNKIPTNFLYSAISSTYSYQLNERNF